MRLGSHGAGASRSDDEYTWFFRGEYNRVVRSVFLLVGDRETARDITQEAFARLYRHWKKVSKYELPEAWVRQVAVRLALQHLRRRRLADRIQPSLPPDQPFDPTSVDLERAIRSLPPAQKAAVVLYYFEDNPSADVARMMDCSEATVRVHLHKARKKLALALERGEINAR